MNSVHCGGANLRFNAAQFGGESPKFEGCIDMQDTAGRFADEVSSGSP
jgi:hypothetical protein